jgi:hypothetical protein
LGWAALLLLGCAKAPETPPSSTPSVVQSQLGSYVYPAWREAQDFKRISEYFTGRENQGGNLILRTDEAERSGMYFHVGLPLGMRFEDGTTAVLEYIHSDAPDVETRTFVLPEMPPGIFAELLLGLTGKDWPKSTRKAKSHHTRSLVAWRITLKDSAGVILVLRQSFLWAMEPT